MLLLELSYEQAVTIPPPPREDFPVVEKELRFRVGGGGRALGNDTAATYVEKAGTGIRIWPLPRPSLMPRAESCDLLRSHGHSRGRAAPILPSIACIFTAAWLSDGVGWPVQGPEGPTGNTEGWKLQTGIRPSPGGRAEGSAHSPTACDQSLITGCNLPDGPIQGQDRPR